MGIEQRLKAKGWTDEEIQNAMQTMQSEKARFSKPTKELNKVLYWISLLIAILGNFVLAVAMIPILLFIGEVPLYFVLAIVGLSFGSLYNIIIRDIEFVDPKHHIIAGIFLPAISIILMFVVVRLVNKLALRSPEIFIHQNIFLIPIIYVFFFMIPYGYTKYAERRLS